MTTSSLTIIRFVTLSLFLASTVVVVHASGNNNNNPCPKPSTSYSSVQEGALFGYSFSSEYLFGRVPSSHHESSDRQEVVVKQVSESSSKKKHSELQAPEKNKGGSSHHDPSISANRRLYHKITTTRTAFLPYAP